MHSKIHYFENKLGNAFDTKRIHVCVVAAVTLRQVKRLMTYHNTDTLNTITQFVSV